MRKINLKIHTFEFLNLIPMSVYLLSVCTLITGCSNLEPFRGLYVMSRPQSNEQRVRFNEGLHTELQIQRSSLVKTEVEIHGCKQIQKLGNATLDGGILNVQDDVFILYEEYSNVLKKCVRNTKKEEYFSGSNINVKLGIRKSGEDVYIRTIGFSDPSILDEEKYSTLPCPWHRIDCWL